jgi:TorA maturation chaperone TorD
MTEYLQGRQAIYEYLYMASYKIPDANFAEISKKFLPVFAALGEEAGGEMADGAEILSNYFKENAQMTDEELALRMNVEFTKLFTKGDEFPLTERRWREKEIAHADTIVSVSNHFADGNVVKPTEINTPIDSYGMELFYLYATSRNAAESECETQDKIITDQIAFAKDHILRWTDKFTNAILEKTNKTNFYHAIAHLSNGFLKYDFSLLESD